MNALTRRIVRWLPYLGGTIGTAIALVLLPATSASAAPEDQFANLGQTPSGLSWIKLEDSRGISMWNFEMSLNRGGITNPDKFFWSTITDACWGIYRSFCALALWFIDWVLGFTWVNTIAAPLLAIGDAMQSVVNGIGLVPTFLMITALLAFLLMVRGRTSTAVYEIAIACVIAALASGAFAQPVRMVAGPDGYIVQAAELGQELAAQLATGDADGKTPQQLREAQTGLLVDTFIRQPTQMINFGKLIDGTDCEAAYDEIVRAGPYGTKSDIRDKVAKCDDVAGDYAGEPSASMALGSMIFFPAAFVVLLLAMVLGGTVITAAVRAMFQSLKAVVTLVTGLLPGGGRGSLMMSVAEALISLVIIVFASIFLSIFLLVIQALFAADDNPARAFVIADIVIVAGLAVYWRQHQNIKAASARLAQRLAQRPGGGPTRMPDRQAGLGMGSVASGVRSAVHMAALRRRTPVAAAPAANGPTFIDQRQQLMVVGGVGPRPTPRPGPLPGGPVDGGEADMNPVGAPRGPNSGPRIGRHATAQLPGGSDTNALPAGAPGAHALPAGRPGAPQLPEGPSGKMKRIESAGKGRKAAGMLARAGTNAALAYATGGTSTVVRGAAKATQAVRTARRTALQAKMATAAVRGRQRPAGTSPVPARPAARATTPAGKGQPVPAGKRPAPAGKIEPALSARQPVRVASAPSTPPSRPSAPRALSTSTAAPSRPATRVDDADRAARLQARLADRSRRASGRRTGE